jgi:DNA mismatch endonuclease (patch repair protein)
VDVITAKRRSALMGRIRAKDTVPEMVVRQLVFAMGRRYRLHARDLPGRPDLVFARDRKVIFVHGCFWHQHARCPEARLPNTRLEYWLPKLEGNLRRDRLNKQKLKRAGWSVLTIRECDLRDIKRVEARVDRFLRDQQKTRRPIVKHNHKH